MKRFLVYSKTRKTYLPYMRQTKEKAIRLANNIFWPNMKGIVIREVEITIVQEHQVK